MLAEVRSARDAKRVMDVASAAKHYATKAKLGQEAVDHAHSIKVQAETMLGRFLQAAPKNKGAKGSKVTGTKRVPVKDDTSTLADLGLTKKESAEAQELATIAEAAPEQYRKLVNNEKTVAAVRRERKRAAVVARLDDVRTRQVKAVAGVFDVIVIDPPWPMEKIERDVPRCQLSLACSGTTRRCPRRSRNSGTATFGT